MFKPMLSASLDGVDLNTLRFPLLGSPKLDGIRAICRTGGVVSRNMKLIRNRYIQEKLKDLEGIDGELIVGAANDPLCMNNTQSGVMSADGEPDFMLHAFDSVGPVWDGVPFQSRLGDLNNYLDHEYVTVVPHHPLYNSTELLRYEEQQLALGYEGIMLRDPLGRYKHGRSTLRDGLLMKLKRFMDGEAIVVGLEEARENQNELTRDELGRAKRSHHQDNKVGKGMIGTILANDPKWGLMRLAPGLMTHHERTTLWHTQGILGKSVHWRAFGYGVKDTPRFPRFYGIRGDL